MAKKLKDYFDLDCVRSIADKLTQAHCPFDPKAFVKACKGDLHTHELKGRVALIGQELHKHLPGEYASKLQQLEKILGPPNEASYGTFNDYFWQWPLSSVVEQYGLPHREDSFTFIYQLTQRSTGEFAVRPFMLEDPEYVFKQLSTWSQDSNFHVRRLSSEGLRPLLPWAKKCTHFVDQPKVLFKMLKGLSNDPEKYVLTSVANHMGDMLKLNPDATKAELDRWSHKAPDNTRWLIRHAIRNLRKKEDAWATELTEKMK